MSPPPISPRRGWRSALREVCSVLRDAQPFHAGRDAGLLVGKAAAIRLRKWVQTDAGARVLTAGTAIVTLLALALLLRSTVPAPVENVAALLEHKVMCNESCPPPPPPAKHSASFQDTAREPSGVWRRSSGWAGWLAAAAFGAACLAAAFEERLAPAFRKSVPMTGAAGVIWLLAAGTSQQEDVTTAAQTSLLQCAEVGCSAVTAMTFVAALEELHVPGALRRLLADQQPSLRQVFWITGLLTFCLSMLVDTLTTAVSMGSLAVALAGDDSELLATLCLNIVCAANAGGACSPDADSATFLVWQRCQVASQQFLRLLIPCLVGWALPAVHLSRSVPQGQLERTAGKAADQLQPGARGIACLFAATSITAVACRSLGGLPPAFPTMAGVAALQCYFWYLQRTNQQRGPRDSGLEDGTLLAETAPPGTPQQRRLGIFRLWAHIDWDTILFLCGVIASTVGLLFLVDLTALADRLGLPTANVLIGGFSAVLDNVATVSAAIPVGGSVLPLNQCLLLALTVGLGCSILSVGSTAGIAVMGLAPGKYTFMRHLRGGSAAVAIGFAAAVVLQLLLNGP